MRNIKKSVYTKDIKNNKQTNLLQDIEISANQFLYPWKDLTAILGAVSLPYINQRLASVYAIESANNIYKNLLDMLQLKDISILNNLSVNGALTGLSYFLLLYALSKPYLNKKAKDCKNLGITDNKRTTGNTIIPIRDTISFNYPKTRNLVCYSNGILPKDFKENDNLERLSKKWGKFVTDVEAYGKDKLIIYYKKQQNKNVLYWKDEYLIKDDCTLVLGEDKTGRQETINLNDSPHLIVAGMSNSRKKH